VALRRISIRAIALKAARERLAGSGTRST
jgi:hypothetical protein